MLKAVKGGREEGELILEGERGGTGTLSGVLVISTVGLGVVVIEVVVGKGGIFTVGKGEVEDGICT